jgi:hypothetical protein
MTNTRCPVPVAGLLEHGQGLAQIAACIVVRSLGLGGQPQVEVCVRFPAWVAERLRKGQCLLEMVGGPFVLAQFVVQDADQEIGVGDIAATTDRAKYVPAACQEGKGRRRDVPQLGEDGLAVREVGNCPRQGSWQRRKSPRPRSSDASACRSPVSRAA